MADYSKNKEVLIADEEIWNPIRSHSIFQGIGDEELQKVLPYFRMVALRPGELLIEEGFDTAKELFLVLKGNLEVIKKTTDDLLLDKSAGNLEQFIIARLAPGDLFGELSFIKGTPRSASVKCFTRAELLALSPEDFEAMQNVSPLAYGIMMKNLAGYVSTRLQKTTTNEVRAMKTELQNSALNAKANLFFSYVIGLLSIYNVTISRISELSLDANNASIISALIIVAFCFGLIIMIKQSKLPIRVMGLTTQGWRPAVKESMFWTTVIITSMITVKWVLITSIPKYQHLPLFDFDFTQQSVGFNFILYTLHSPIQEFVARGVLQGSLQHFFSGKNVAFRATFVSNALFSATHVHLMGGLLAVIVFIPGLFWGWLYSRHNNLIGVSVSHILIGWVGLFFLNIESLF